MTRLSARDLNRTLLHRQHLLERTSMPVPAMVEHLVGLQAQDSLPPYLSLAARLTDLDPYAVSRRLEDRSLVRLLTMRGTIHLLVPDDALSLRSWTTPVQERELKQSEGARPALHLDREELAAVVREVLVDPMPVGLLGETLAAHFPDVAPTNLAHVARLAQPLVQTPPRGCWKQPGGVVYALVDRWLGRPEVDQVVEDLVRRYLRAYGPATAADMTAWSGVTRLGPVLKVMDDLVVHEGPDGKPLFDVPDGEIVAGDRPAPVRLLGTYDNLWLAHAGRDRVTTAESRGRWMGRNGGTGHTVFVDGMMEGLWKVVDGRVEITAQFRDLTRDEQHQLDEEIARVDALLAR
ncbi:winged helix DNA-binding domain-containing protein [Nocardioides sp.]|uniref:winged helix DNA-binding domain-containing protein n=1 Tax=Nocardioides sp. TaxID=35761 RepID=UPI0027333359|nr:winged helix DNA-binding domain-containing protein [Nocardioides sp.]MDP3891099.1 winged helix DNA-binding domain-containing protein [Nocardioides sp.]